MAAEAWLGPLGRNVDTWQVGFREFIAAAVWPDYSKPIIHFAQLMTFLSALSMENFKPFSRPDEYPKCTIAQEVVSISLIFLLGSRVGEVGELYLQEKL